MSKKLSETEPAKIDKTENSVVEKGGYTSSDRRASELPPPPASLFQGSAGKPQAAASTSDQTVEESE